MTNIINTHLEIINHILIKHPEIRIAVGNLISNLSDDSSKLSISKTLKNLRSLGVEITTAVDVGAHIGEWAINFWDVYPNAQILSIEANEENYNDLCKVNPNSLQLCLGKDNGEKRTFYLPDEVHKEWNTGASLL